METFEGQAKNWINPRIGKKKLREFSAIDADKFFQQIAPFLAKRSLVSIKSILRRSIRRAQVHDLIGRNVIELIDLPAGKPGRPSRAMTEEQAAKVLRAATGRNTEFVKVVKASNGPTGATHAAAENGNLACGTWPHPKATITELSQDLNEASCLSCRRQLGLDTGADANRRLSAMFVLSITLGLRPGELRKLSWDMVDLPGGVIHVWRSASKSGDTKTQKSKRSLVLPQRAIRALETHKVIQDRERELAGEIWQETNLVFCHENGAMYSSEGLNWRFSRMTKKAGIGHWHAHEGRHTAVSIMSKNGVPIQDISDTVGHKSPTSPRPSIATSSCPRSAVARRSWTASSAPKTTKAPDQSSPPRRRRTRRVVSSFSMWDRGAYRARFGEEEAARRRGAIMAGQWGHQLAEQRKRLGFTQAGLAEIMSVNPDRVSQIEHGEVSTVEALASYITALGGKLELIADIGGHLLKMPANPGSGSPRW
jgi:integrase/DNA-binding XRE family transcriptional regulator